MADAIALPTRLTTWRQHRSKGMSGGARKMIAGLVAVFFVTCLYILKESVVINVGWKAEQSSEFRANHGFGGGLRGGHRGGGGGHPALQSAQSAHAKIDTMQQQLSLLQEYLDSHKQLINNATGTLTSQLATHAQTLQSHNDLLDQHAVALESQKQETETKLREQQESWEQWFAEKIATEEKGRCGDLNENACFRTAVCRWRAQSEACEPSDAERDAIQVPVRMGQLDSEDAEGEDGAQPWQQMVNWLEKPEQTHERQKSHEDPFAQIMDQLMGLREPSTTPSEPPEPLGAEAASQDYPSRSQPTFRIYHQPANGPLQLMGSSDQQAGGAPPNMFQNILMSHLQPFFGGRPAAQQQPTAFPVSFGDF